MSERPPIEISKMRFTKAVALVVNSAVVQPSTKRPIYLVQGGDENPYVVMVTPEVGSCDCPWGQYAPTDWSNPCSHVLAAAAYGEVAIPPVWVITSTD